VRLRAGPQHTLVGRYRDSFVKLLNTTFRVNRPMKNIRFREWLLRSECGRVWHSAHS
jgi:hypothetical protein